MLQSHLKDHRLVRLKLSPVLVVNGNERFAFLLILAGCELDSAAAHAVRIVFGQNSE